MGLNELAIIQAAQTAALTVVAGAVIYAFYLLRLELRGAVSMLGDVIKSQTELDRNVRRSWERIDAVEERLNRLEQPRPR